MYACTACPFAPVNVALAFTSVAKLFISDCKAFTELANSSICILALFCSVEAIDKAPFKSSVSSSVPK